MTTAKFTPSAEWMANQVDITVGFIEKHIGLSVSNRDYRDYLVNEISTTITRWVRECEDFTDESARELLRDRIGDDFEIAATLGVVEGRDLQAAINCLTDVIWGDMAQIQKCMEWQEEQRLASAI